ncbi:MAG: proline hydroxylase [Leptolyngbyaceae cyanobacterium RU_5_1]|nr:proline hydroxylase [Leptolyngbyaceae cyanobacterium RU_5_1]
MSTQPPSAPPPNLQLTEMLKLWDKVDRVEPGDRFIPSLYVQIENFLNADEVNDLLDYTLVNEHRFEPAKVRVEYESDERKAVVLWRREHFADVADFMSRRVHRVLPEVLPKLKVVEFPISRTEVQMTAFRDGNYFKQHRDNYWQDSRRKLSFVYYFHRQPKPFTGGELRLYDSMIEDGCYEPAESFKTIEPWHNSIVFFHSRNAHEVLPIRCPSQQFRDSRFTVNGWLHR